MTELSEAKLMDMKVELPFGAPPIIPDVEKQLKEYIISPDDLPIHDYKTAQQYWPRIANPKSLYNVELSKPTTTLKVLRDATTGHLKDIKETFISGDPVTLSNHLTADDIFQLAKNIKDEDIGLGGELRKVAPWFSRGFHLQGEEKEATTDEKTQTCPSGTLKTDFGIETTQKDEHVYSLADVVSQESEILKCLQSAVVEENNQNSPSAGSIVESSALALEDEVIKLIPEEVKFKSPVIRISDVKPLKGVTSTEWAEVIDVSKPVTDFHQRIPDMAFKYEFELDTFQKQAILKLEEHCSVLVSAHTSAGKTVVAEYAIALSQKHMTRTIYTSPIKALSNQKYRDFRNTFKDVGLITGDFQINSTGTCLIMTTEILRSMLLAQNDVIRDLEYVIFDEVHYVNDLDRGHVWEEVVILLPPYVSIVMLSATIPNALQFADWVGRTKQRKMYVISTPQRPVPLEHFLYTGSGGSSRDERFLILSATNEFQKKGYNNALEAKKKREGKVKEGAKNRFAMSRKQETTMWVALLQHLQKHDKLPIVAFTLSRKRCDENAESLQSMDLTTAKEKSHIRHFFQQSIEKLKEPDQNLPQILKLRQLLENGIGVHHSGILPILKEIVEMLFQERCVKVLFATETFAMGVNMPAKTVVFDSIKKYDGIELRTLLPSEYIQMAGRAGRRGLDDTGTVIIICKGDVPSELDLLAMMKGMPKKIESQFRLTYSIILKLERKRVAAEGRVTVEEMMANSFKEADFVKKKKTHGESLEQVEKELKDMEISISQGGGWEQLRSICRNTLEYLNVWRDLSPGVFCDKQALKMMTPGRLLLITHKHHRNKLGVLLSCDFKKVAKFKVLVLSEKDEQPDGGIFLDEGKDSKGRSKEIEQMEEEWYRVLGLVDTHLFVPGSVGHHVVLTLDPWDIVEVTTIAIKIDSKILLGDWENRQIPRFRDNPPGQSFKKALEELTEITHNAKLSNSKLEYWSPFKEMTIKSEIQLNQVARLSSLKRTIQETSVDHIIDFENQLKEVFKLKYLENKKQSLEYLLSYQSMSLYEDYQNRLNVLRELQYVDSKNSVQVKGSVACEMSNQELLITELVYRSALNDLQPAEIAALLSCFVYQGKRQDEPIVVTATLEKGIGTIKQVAKEVFAAEYKYGVCQTDASGNEDNLNFDLVPVVYEWARDKPFSLIMTLTDIQEGIIVRCIQKLNEIIRDVKDAARIIGEATLQQKMEDASTAIKRDIVFVGSLYMQ